MSSAAAWANTVKLTLWRKGERDIYGEYGYSEPEVILCTYKVGGSEKYIDSTGLEFTPDTIYYTEMKTPAGDYLVKPKTGDKLELGEHTGAPSVDAGDIRMITIYDAQMFGESEQPDYMLGV